MTTLVTGATGFLGHALCTELAVRNLDFAVAVRAAFASPAAWAAEGHATEGQTTVIGDIGPDTNWQKALSGVDCVVHCAARAHVMKEARTDPMAIYRKVNVEGTRKLAQQAGKAGVRRFVFVSSIKVNGEETPADKRFSFDDPASPEDAYGISKHEAEQALHELSQETGLEVVILRPPLVYGPAVKGNFLAMLGWLKRGVPLPLGAIDNRRSLIGIDNLVDLIITALDHPAAANQTFLASDGEDISTSRLLRLLGRALGRPARLIPVPVTVLHAGARLAGRQGLARRLCGNLQVDISHTEKTLGWTPPVDVRTGLQKTADWYLTQNDSLA